MTTIDVATALRPTERSEFVGQTALMDRLEIHMAAAIELMEPMPHVLLTGPPGFGKTTLAGIIATTLGEPFEALTMPMKPKAFYEFLYRFDGGIVLLDELHRAPRAQQEDFLTLLEDGYVSTPNGERIAPPWITVVAATTEPEKIIPPIYDRFPCRPTFAPYAPDEVTAIVQGMAIKLDLDIDDELASALGRAAAGTPRNARQLILATRAWIAATGETPSAADVLSLCQVDPDGLTQTHLDYLGCLDRVGGSAGLRTLSTHLRLHDAVLRDLERLLVERRLVTYGDTGRQLTAHGRRKLTPTPTTEHQHRPIRTPVRSVQEATR